MRRLLRNVGWLLVPEPSEEWALRYGAWLYLLASGVWVTIGFSFLSFASPLRSFLDVFSDALTAWVGGIAFATLAALYALPADRRRARLGARVACTLSLLALAPSFLLRFFDPNEGRISVAIVGLFPLATIVLTIVLVLSINYFVNRRRARRPRGTPCLR